MLLLVDHLALRARNYEYLIHLFQEWEVGVRQGALGGAAARLGHPRGSWLSALQPAHTCARACVHPRPRGRRRPETGPHTRAEARRLDASV